MSQGDTNDDENVIARLDLNEVKELDEAIQRDCFLFASLWALAHIARNDRKRVCLFSRERRKNLAFICVLFSGETVICLCHTNKA
jgi:hypothetical protein